MRGHRQYDFGIANIRLLLAQIIARRLHREHAGFRAAAGEIADDIAAAVQMRRRKTDQLALHAREARIDRRIERVLGEILHVGALRHALHIRSAVIDVSERLAFAPRHVGFREIGELLEDGLFVETMIGHFAHRPLLPARLCADAVAIEFVGDGICQRLERGIDDVGRHADRRPARAFAVGAFDHHARHGLGAACEDTHLIIDETQILQDAGIFSEVFAQRAVERVDRAVARGRRCGTSRRPLSLSRRLLTP